MWSLAWELITEGDVIDEAVEKADEIYFGGVGVSDRLGAGETIKGGVEFANSIANGKPSGMVAGAANLALGRFKILNIRGGSSEDIIKGSLSLLVVDGKISFEELSSFALPELKNSFSPNERISAGQKYRFMIGDVPMEIKWHSPDVKWKGSGNNSGSGWTAQIMIGKNKKRVFLTTSGSWTKKVGNDTHIPVRF